MKIGLLAYHSVCNFGATLQLLSTYSYLINHHHKPVVINWIPEDLEAYYKKNVPFVQQQEQIKSRQKYWVETSLCRNSHDIANIIQNEGIEAVIIGSDAVAQHHPLLERIVFPCRTIIGINKNTSDREFPNAFWADWIQYLPKSIPVALISASNQDSFFKLIRNETRMHMAECISRYSYISARDTWTQQMFSYITKGNIKVPITPDPVFAFGMNANPLIPSREETLKKFSLPDKYYAVSFLDDNKCPVTQKWINSLILQAQTENITCVSLPFAHGKGFGRMEKEISLPLNPIDWYAIIIYSQGYIGNNMHPIVVCLHNKIPFFSFDNYGTTHLNGLMSNDSSSKIKHILSQANLTVNRISCISRNFTPQNPSTIISSLNDFNYLACQKFRDDYLEQYCKMMENVLNTLKQ